MSHNLVYNILANLEKTRDVGNDNVQFFRLHFWPKNKLSLRVAEKIINWKFNCIILLWMQLNSIF
jgi:hypothetical protein